MINEEIDDEQAVDVNGDRIAWLLSDPNSCHDSDFQNV